MAEARPVPGVYGPRQGAGPRDLGDGLRGRVEALEEGLRRATSVADRNAEAGAPARMVALYVELEVRHALAGHHAPPLGVECTPCHLSLGSDL